MIKILKKVIFLLVLTVLLTPIIFAEKGGINIGPYYGQMSDAATAVPGGFIYVLGCPGDVPRIWEAYQSNQNSKLMIRAFFRGGNLDTPEEAQKLASEWIKALNALPTTRKVYFMPANEINNPVEQFRNSDGSLNPTRIKNLVVYLEQILAGVNKQKVVVLSPSLDPFQLADNLAKQEPELRRIPWSRFDGVSISLYGQYLNGSLDQNAHPLKRGDWSALPSYIPTNNLYIVETGVAAAERSKNLVIYGSDTSGGKTADSLISEYLSARRSSNWAGGNVRAVIVFSYNPDPGGNRRPWIYGSQTASQLQQFNNGSPVESAPAGSGDFSGLSTGCASTREQETVFMTCDTNLNTIATVSIRDQIAAKIRGETEINLGQLTPNGEGKTIDLLTNYSVYTNENVQESVLPRKFDVYSRDDPDYDLPPDPNQIKIKDDFNDKPVTLQSNVYPGQATINGRAVGNATQQQGISDKPITITNDSADIREFRDAGRYFGAVIGKAPLQPQNGVYDNSTPREILRDRLEIPLQGGNGQQVAEVPQSQAGENIYTDQQGNILNGISYTLTDAFLTLVGEATAATIFGIEANAQISSCARTSAIDSTIENVRQMTHSGLPRAVAENIRARGDSEHRTGYQLNTEATEIGVTVKKGDFLVKSVSDHLCSTLPRKTATYREKCGGESASNFPTPTPDGTPRNVSSNELMIDLKNTSCRVPNIATALNQQVNGEETLRSFIQRYYARWGRFGVVNFERFAETVQNLAVNRGYNPAFLLAMWIEETAASGVDNQTSWAFGCRGDLRNDNKYGSEITLQPGQMSNEAAVNAHIAEQFECIANTLDAAYENSSGFSVRDTYSRFMKAWSSGSYTGLFPTGPNRIISMWYNELVGQCGVLETLNQ